MDFVLKQPFPYKSLDFIDSYLSIYYCLNRKDKWRLFRPLYTILALKIGHYLFLALYELPPTAQKLLANDMVRLANLPPEVNIVIVASLFIAGYFFYLNYFQNHLTVDFFAQIIDARWRGVGVSSSSLFIFNYRKSSKPVAPYIRRVCFAVLNLLQIFILAIGKSFKSFL